MTLPMIVDVPTDAKARHTLLSINVLGQGLIQFTARSDAPSGIYFTKREVDYARGTWRYVSEGDTLESLEKDIPISRVGPLIEGSISTFMSRAACAAAGVELQGVELW